MQRLPIAFYNTFIIDSSFITVSIYIIFSFTSIILYANLIKAILIIVTHLEFINRHMVHMTAIPFTVSIHLF